MIPYRPTDDAIDLPRRSAVLALAGLALSGVGAPAPVSAHVSETKPDGNLKCYVPFPKGGFTDTIVRMVGRSLAVATQMPVVIENLMGEVEDDPHWGDDQAAQVAPDMRSFLAVTVKHAALASIHPHARRFNEQVRPVAMLVSTPLVVVVPDRSHIKDFKELQMTAKTQLMTVASSGIGSASHLAMALFNNLNGSKMKHMAFSGGPMSLKSLSDRKSDVSFANYTEVLPLMKAGKLRPLAILSLGRVPSLPYIPTAIEQGMNGLFFENWVGMMMHSQTTDSVVRHYAETLVQIMHSPEAEKAAQQVGFRIAAKNSEEFEKFWQYEVSRIRNIIRYAHITPP